MESAVTGSRVVPATTIFPRANSSEQFLCAHTMVLTHLQFVWFFYNEEEDSVGYSYIKGLYMAVSRRNRLVGFQQSSATRGKQTVQHEGHGEDYFYM